jgi:pyrroloquinoline quinone biosynthesis protein B
VLRASQLWLILLAGCAAPSPADEPATTGHRFELVVLGIAQDGGLPHLGCQRPCCDEARRSGRRLSPACLVILDRESGRALLIEATPAIESQLARFRAVTGTAEAPRRPVDAVLVTHAHIGHYAGLIHFGREVASTDAIPLHVSARMAEFLRANGPWGQLVALEQVRLVPFAPGETFAPLDGIAVTAIAVPHRDEYSDTVALRIAGPARTVLFCPDIDRYEGDSLETLLDGVDVAYLDGTFYDGREIPGRDLAEIPHPPMVVTMERLAERARAAPGSVRFIHLNHTNPALHESDVRRAIEARGFRIAEEGERLGL